MTEFVYQLNLPPITDMLLDGINENMLAPLARKADKSSSFLYEAIPATNIIKPEYLNINGFEFIDGKTSVLIDDQPVDFLTVFSDKLLGFFTPKTLTNGLKSITIRVDTEEIVVPDFFDVGSPSLTPKIEFITIHGNDAWVYVTGTDFVWGQTTITFNEKTIDISNTIKKVGVFVNQDYDLIINKINQFNLDFVQLNRG